MRNVFKSVLAFLLVNNLLSRELISLTDGAQDIRSHIRSVFRFHPYTVILDWLHLKKRCQKWLSMAIRGKDRRNAVLEKAQRYLGAGDVTSASEYLSSLDSAVISSAEGTFLPYRKVRRQTDMESARRACSLFYGRRGIQGALESGKIRYFLKFNDFFIGKKGGAVLQSSQEKAFSKIQETME